MSYILPKISVLVSSYNQQSYIIECLESIKSQSYKNFEIIITDDNSTDNTLLIISEWILSNSQLSIKLVTSKINTGVSKNFQRGLNHCSGEWIKVIAADDKLLANSLESIKLCYDNLDNLSLIFSKSIYFDSSGPLYSYPLYNNINVDNYKSDYIFYENFFNVPTLFYNKKFLLKVGGFDINYRNMEDYPTILKMLNNGGKFAFNNIETIAYRITDQSLSNYNLNGDKINRGFLNSYLYFYKKILRPFHLQNTNYIFMKLSDMKFFFLLKHLSASNIFKKRIFYKISAIFSVLINGYLIVFKNKNRIFL